VNSEFFYESLNVANINIWLQWFAFLMHHIEKGCWEMRGFHFSNQIFNGNFHYFDSCFKTEFVLMGDVDLLIKKTYF
jgi:hypothetical protein